MVILIIVLVVLALFLIFNYNSFQKLNLNVDNAFADLDAFLMKRVDQLDNLIQTARQATDKEIEALENVIGLRQGILKASNPNEKIKAHNQLTREMQAITITIERYPELQFNENYLHIQRSINEIEEQIQAARRNYNGHVGKFNKSIAVFPGNVIAGFFRFTPREMFETPQEKRENVDVKALFNR
ncbi:LemA family protein [Salipaludibacillus sp. LMS25]|jgi:LemA protein|uniref:LemA family protein n=1 Tax=Salipaludibacillus sp. LMS25 TaxID=2924031 RepID=UPI0020D0482C|nr:LemA family protein [Salipaludibacillus sp. LMS25]UTR13231.1 LemA family protein [Salipaludibacillus sp. LMS25]